MKADPRKPAPLQAARHGRLEMAPMRYEPDRPKAADPVLIQDCSFRDGHQSLFATRGRTEDLAAVAEAMDGIGFWAMEVWGGATFDTAHRYLNEDPWERLHVLKRHIRRTPLSMLLRGQNLVGYRNYADDVVEAFVQRSCDNGIDVFRVFDALNDFRNFETAVRVIKKNGRHFQATICYSLTEPRMGGEVYNLDYYLENARRLERMGADSICIKDMAGLIAPYDAYNLVSALKSTVKVPIHLHTHFTSGMGDLAVLKAIEAGVDIVDTCLSPFAYRSSHAAVEPLVVSLYGTNRDTGFDIEKLVAVSEEMEKFIPKYMHFANQTRYSIIDTNVILHQTPGGMLSNLVSQLKQMGELEKLEQVFRILPQVRRELGQVPLVTPTSQIVGIQAVNNVLFDREGERYTKITEQVKDLCYGLYGATPRPIDPEVRRKALQDYPRGQKPITERPGGILEPELPKARAEIGELARNIDDLLIYALFPVTGRKFLRWKYGLEKAPDEVRPKSLEEVRREAELVRRALAGELIEPEAAQAKGAGGAGPRPENLRRFDVYVDGDHFVVEVSDRSAAGGPGGGPEGRRVPVPPAAAGPGVAAGPAAGGAGGKPAAPPPPTGPAAASTGKAPPAAAPAAPAAPAGAAGLVRAPMPGMIVRYEKKVGEPVKAGETVVVIEAMKMNNNLAAPCDGVVRELPFREGDPVAKNDVLAVIGAG